MQPERKPMGSASEPLRPPLDYEAQYERNLTREDREMLYVLRIEGGVDPMMPDAPRP